jgi:hypothetical protein
MTSRNTQAFLTGAFVGADDGNSNPRATERGAYEEPDGGAHRTPRRYLDNAHRRLVQRSQRVEVSAPQRAGAATFPHKVIPPPK